MSKAVKNLISEECFFCEQCKEYFPFVDSEAYSCDKCGKIICCSCVNNAVNLETEYDEDWCESCCEENE